MYIAVRRAITISINNGGNREKFNIVISQYWKKEQLDTLLQGKGTLFREIQNTGR